MHTEKRSTRTLFAIVALCLSGCASVAVTSDSLEDRTAFALSMKKEDFTISNRKDDGLRTDYLVRTKSGAQYNCYVTGTVGITGRNVSDAICNQAAPIAMEKKTDKSIEKKTAAPGAQPCNALLKAANKC